MIAKKGLLIFPQNSFSWLEPFFPYHPWYWETLGLPWGEYFLQAFHSLGIENIRILSDLPALPQLPQGVQWKHSHSLPHSLDVLRENRFFLQGSPALVLKAPFFIFDLWNQEKAELPSSLQFQGSMPKDHSLAYVFIDDHTLAPLPWSSLGVFSMEDYFFLCQILLKGSVPKHLAGTQDTNGGIFLHPKANVPSQLTLGPGVYVGPKSKIGKDCEINRSLLYGHQVLGSKVILDNKILIGNRILSPLRGTHAIIDDPGILKLEKMPRFPSF